MESVLDLWALSLRDAKARICPLFTQARVVTIPRYDGHGLRPTRPRRVVLC